MPSPSLGNFWMVGLPEFCTIYWDKVGITDYLWLDPSFVILCIVCLSIQREPDHLFEQNENFLLWDLLVTWARINPISRALSEKELQGNALLIFKDYKQLWKGDIVLISLKVLRKCFTLANWTGYHSLQIDLSSGKWFCSNIWKVRATSCRVKENGWVHWVIILSLSSAVGESHDQRMSSKWGQCGWWDAG